MPRIESSVARGFLEKEQTPISTMAFAISLSSIWRRYGFQFGCVFFVFALLLKDI